MKSLLTLVLSMAPFGSTMLVGQSARFDVIGKKFVGAYIGTRTHCFFWSLDPPNLWRVEAACYYNNDLKTIYVMKTGEKLIATYNSDEGSISWFFLSPQVVPPETMTLTTYNIVIGATNNTELVRIDSF